MTTNDSTGSCIAELVD